MNEKFIILMKNIMKRKVFTIIVFLLSLCATLLLVTALGTVTKVKSLYDNSYDKTNSGDIFFGFIDNVYSDKYEKEFKNNKLVKEVIKDNNLIGSINITEDEALETIISEYNKEIHDYSIESNEDYNYQLKDNEAVVPSYYKDAYDITEGDSIYYKSGKVKIEFKVKGFFEDHIFGSPLYETKRILISKEFFKEIKDKYKSENLTGFTMLNVNLKDEYKEEDFSKNTTKILDEFKDGTISVFSLDRTFMTTVRLMVPRVISLVLIVFSIFIVIILSIILRYTILATIETDFTSMGVLKALGFRAKDIEQILILQFTIVSLIGSIIGGMIAYKVTPIVGKMLLSSSGIWWTGSLDLKIILAVILILYGFITVNVYLISRVVKNIKPMEAILYGRGAKKKSKKGISLEKGIFSNMQISISYSIKQLVSNFSRYSTLLILCIILTFMISTILGLNSIFNNEEKVSSLLGYSLYDVKIDINDSNIVNKEKINNILDEIENKYDTSFITTEEAKKIEIDNTTVSLVVSSIYNDNSVVEGNAPKNENEIMITDGIRNLINKDIGDTVQLSFSKDSSESEEYKIVGINNNVLELGKNISITSKGYEKFEEDYLSKKYFVKLEKSNNLDDVINELRNKYENEDSGISISNARTDQIKTISLIQGALSGASFAIVVISILLIILIIVLISLVIIANEILNIGILKSIGFKSIQIRFQLVFRFLLVSSVGAIIGAILNSFISEKIINAFFRIASISKVPTGVTISVYLISITFVLITTILCTGLISRRIKNIKTKVLLIE